MKIAVKETTTTELSSLTDTRGAWHICTNENIIPSGHCYDGFVVSHANALQTW